MRGAFLVALAIATHPSAPSGSPGCQSSGSHPSSGGFHAPTSGWHSSGGGFQPSSGFHASGTSSHPSAGSFHPSAGGFHAVSSAPSGGGVHWVGSSPDRRADIARAVAQQLFVPSPGAIDFAAAVVATAVAQSLEMRDLPSTVEPTDEELPAAGRVVRDIRCVRPERGWREVCLNGDTGCYIEATDGQLYRCDTVGCAPPPELNAWCGEP